MQMIQQGQSVDASDAPSQGVIAPAGQGPSMIGTPEDPRQGLIQQQSLAPVPGYDQRGHNIAQDAATQAAVTEASGPQQSVMRGAGPAIARGIPVAGAFADEGDAALMASIAPYIEPLLKQAPAGVQHALGYDQRYDVGAGPTWQDRYNQSINLQHLRDHGYDAQHPIASTALQGAGAIAGTVAALPALGAGTAALGPEAGLIPRAAVGGLEGAGLGAAQGYGGGNGALTDPSRGRGAETGGMIGAALGAAAPAVIQGAQGLWNATGQRAINAVAPKVAVGEAPSLADALAGAQGAPQAATRAGLPSDIPGATNRLVDALAAINVSPKAAVAPADAKAAYSQLYRALQRQGTSATDAVQSAKDLGTFGMVADSGPATQDLGRTVMNTPSAGAVAGKDALDLRQLGVKQDGDFLVRPSSLRIGDAAASGLGVGGKEYYSGLDSLAASQKAAAGPAYTKAYAAPPVPTSELEDFRVAGGGDFESAYARARAISQKTFVDMGDGVEKIVPLPAAIPKQLDWRTLDLMKQGLDDNVRQNVTDGIGANEQGALKGYLGRFVAKLDSINPDYGAAREAFAGPAKLMDAQEAGAKFMGQDAPVISSGMAELSPSEQQAFRLGAAKQIQSKLGNADITADASRVAGSLKPNQLQRFKAIFPDQQSYAGFSNLLDNEKTMFNTRAAATGNSTTAKQLAGMQDAGEDPLAAAAPMIGHAAAGNVPGALSAAMGFIKNAGNGSKMNEGTSDALAAILFNMDKRTYPAVLSGLSDAEKRVLLANALRQAAPTGAAQAGGDAFNKGSQ